MTHHLPTSTYRLQIREDFPLSAASALVDYLALLGVGWVYVSPLLQAEAGSDHGYDVTDHSRVDDSRGGPEGLAALSAAARDAGLGVLVDIVPNHMGVASPAQNAWWWDLLTHGRESRYASAFDIDWDFGGGRVRIPVLGDLAEGEVPELSIVDGELRYFDHRFPTAPGTADDGAEPSVVHDRQHYVLVSWRRADAELNYRRFFAVNSLASIRVEEPWVFEESHREIVRWVTEGLVDGIRVDHPDGLADPGGYLDDLAAATGGTYVLVEKILEGEERLPAHWQAAGTTGYDALADIDRILTDPAGRARLDELDRALRGSERVIDWSDLIHDTKRGIADGILRSEILRIARLMPELERAEDALAELAACFPVYRSYLPHGRANLVRAVQDASKRRPDLADVIEAVAARLGDPDDEAAVRFQQTSGMVMAKGVEDTAFYRYSRLASLTEVGADPDEFSINLGEFHRRQESRLAAFPASLTTLTTHDTKRGEDVRARIAVLSERPDLWRDELEHLRSFGPLDDGPFENILWETIVGSWPLTRERLAGYAEKAAREAGSSTGWSAPDEAFEAKLSALVDRVFDDEELTHAIEEIVERIAPAGRSNSLAAKLIQLTAPGVPDVYQGSELWELSLVDPDNRRAVDFDLRRLLLSAIDAGAHPALDAEGATKLLVVSRALRARRDHPELFSRYLELTAVGPAARHVVAFDRGGAMTIATRLPIGLEAKGGWGDTRVLTPKRAVTDLLTGATYEGGALPLAEVLAKYPVALLVPSETIDA